VPQSLCKEVTQKCDKNMFENEGIESFSENTDNFLKDLKDSGNKKKSIPPKKIDYPEQTKQKLSFAKKVEPVKKTEPAKKKIKDRANQVLRKVDFRLKCTVHARNKVEQFDMKAKRQEFMR
jgi:predicted RNA-binding protein with RPS1 domain